MAIDNGVLDSTEKKFATSEKVTVALFTAQELIISSVYIYETVKILRVGEMMRQNNRHRILKLLAANIAVMCLDVSTITLEYSALFGVWCSFKGFAYTVKLKIEFSILNQLRDSVTKNGRSGGTYPDHSGSEGITLSSRKSKINTKPTASALERNTFSELQDHDAIMRTTHITVQRSEHAGTPMKNSHGFPLVHTDSLSATEHAGSRKTKTPSEVSSEVEFATKGVY
ncbi:hypothetical protein SLS60_008865 [Paraconiothyrium brasiliense]|uniref:DUF7703 domain-containing protein n=1 Tax=Paraconiothyrium brasiliense TaxID=300254 RepID=A0ABR3QYP6_9PLEO